MSKHDKRANGGDRSTLGGGRAALFGAVEALLAELERFEGLATEAQKIPLDSQKNLDRSVRAAQEAIAVQAKIGERLGGLIATIDTVRVRQETTARSLDAHVQALQARAAQYGALGDRLAGLVTEASEINVLVQACAAELRDATAGLGAHPTARVDTILDRMATLAESAQKLADEAGAGGWADLVRQADSMRQQMLSARNKLLLVRRGMPAKA